MQRYEAVVEIRFDAEEGADVGSTMAAHMDCLRSGWPADDRPHAITLVALYSLGNVDLVGSGAEFVRRVDISA